MNKKILNILFICLICLFLISSVNAADNDTVIIADEGNDIVAGSSVSSNHQITSDLSNDDIQGMFDNANDGDTFEFSDAEYENISLVVDKKLNIVSNSNSKVYTSNQITSKAESLGITNTFGFYFTSNSCGSILSGITIIASNSDYGVIVNSSDVTIKNNVITGGRNGVLIKDSSNIVLKDNAISKATLNGVQLHNVSNSVITKNAIFNNGKSGIETRNIYYCDINNNTVHHNNYNGISMYAQSTGNKIKYNNVSENDNGIFINSTSSKDVINANSFTYNRNDPSNEEIGGGTETGNGLLFGSGFRTAREGDPTRLEFKYNILAHNENYQAKNNPELSRTKFKLGDNWFDSNDDQKTFVCPFLLAGIMKMDTISVKNGIGLQMYDTKGQPVKEFGTFDTTVNVNGNQYTARFVNGKAIIEADLDPDKEYEIEVMIGGEPVKYTYKPAAGEKDDYQGSQSDTSNNGESSKSDASNKKGSSDSDSKIQYRTPSSTSSNSGGIAKGNSNGGNSTSAHYSNSKSSGVYGTNASGTRQDSSDNGQYVQTNGDVNAGDSSSGEVSQEGKAYEVVPPSKISKEITDTSALVVLSIMVIMGCLIYGYWRKRDFD
jgi:parallel beta-helix repeat protein